jgi:signal transduction histidine kinase/ActR/RegA family two-component response regulator
MCQGGWTSLIHAEDLSIVSQRPPRWLMGQTDISEFRIITQRGEERWFRDYTCPVHDGYERYVMHIYGAGQEITERRRLEEPLRQSQKMEAIGRLAGGIAHDFNNLLQVISGYSDMLQRRLTRQRTLCRYVQEIKNVAEQGAVLTRQLMTVSRKSSFQSQVLDFEGIISNIIPILRRLLGEDIELIASVTPGLGQVIADSGQLEQVILNLAVNARDAMPQGGRLILDAVNVKLDAPLASRLGGMAPGEYIRFAVSDTGSGMDAETQAHIFEPFFTTKEPGRGTGLGLSTVYGIVEQTGGNILVYSEEGNGTSFKVYLPRTEGQAASTAPATQTTMPVGGETILVVEDEDMVRGLACRILERLGYAVLRASNGTEAIAVSDKHDAKIDLLVTDLVMPAMNGGDLARRLVSDRPELRVLYMSGYADNGIVQMGLVSSHSAFLAKPFAAQALAQKVRQVLDEQTVN